MSVSDGEGRAKGGVRTYTDERPDVTSDGTDTPILRDEASCGRNEHKVSRGVSPEEQSRKQLTIDSLPVPNHTDL